ncbi:hypothetical protein QM480_19350 [Flectobacillus sp. DC10W]|uniref:TonB C-terminal domain-containing protein n=1 Tax=Flectobacillus longus TaxID=2984207 RepID=A0ABT6YSD1_9BACT|nr:hypothetical protein [Flectobacillus longus]MDI9866507.1 hypothetical protein [Flectobacillus longus]
MKTYQEELEEQKNKQVAFWWTIAVGAILSYTSVKLSVWDENTKISTYQKIRFALADNDLDETPQVHITANNKKIREASGPAAPNRENKNTSGAETSYTKKSPYKAPKAKLPSSISDKYGYSPEPKAFVPNYGAQRGEGLEYGLDHFYLAQKPLLTDKTSEVGKIVFKITVDDNGQILSIRVLSTTLTESTTNIYKEDIKYGAVFRPRYLKGTTIAKISSGLLTVRVNLRGNTQFVL